MLKVDLTIGDEAGLALGITDADLASMDAGQPFLLDLARPASFLAIVRGPTEADIRRALKAAQIETIDSEVEGK